MKLLDKLAFGYDVVTAHSSSPERETGGAKDIEDVALGGERGEFKLGKKVGTKAAWLSL